MTTPSNPELSVVIPIYNEAQNLRSLLEELQQQVVPLVPALEVVMVDDASTDGTTQLLQQLLGRYPWLRVLRQLINCGHGSALLVGYAAVRGKWVFQVDGDRQFDLADFALLWNKRDAAIVVLGVRRERNDPWVRRLGSWILRAGLLWRFKTYLRDTNSPFRLIRRDWLVKKLALFETTTLVPNIAMALLACREQVLFELSVQHFERTAGKSSLPVRQYLRFGLQAWHQLQRLTLSFGLVSKRLWNG